MSSTRMHDLGGAPGSSIILLTKKWVRFQAQCPQGYRVAERTRKRAEWAVRPRWREFYARQAAFDHCQRLRLGCRSCRGCRGAGADFLESLGGRNAQADLRR